MKSTLDNDNGASSLCIYNGRKEVKCVLEIETKQPRVEHKLNS